MSRTPRVATRATGVGIGVYSPAHLSLAVQRQLADVVGEIVLPGAKGAELARGLRTSGYDGRLMVDPGEYSDQARAHDAQDQLFDARDDWLLAQNSADVSTYLSPSPLVPAGDKRALSRVLIDGGRFCERVSASGGDAYLALALDAGWLTSHLSALLDKLVRVDWPVALILAHRNDPLGRRGAIRAITELVAAVPHVALLRSDLAAIAAVAYGATFGAVGVSSATRHVVPPGHEGGGGRGDSSPSVLVRSLLRYLRGSMLERLEAAGDRLVCHCYVCGGKPLTRFGDRRFKAEAQAHSVVEFADLALGLLCHETTADKVAAWRGLCQCGVGPRRDRGSHRDRTSTTSSGAITGLALRLTTFRFA